MKIVELTHAEVTPFYGTQDVIKEVEVKTKTGSATIINFNIKTRINDRVSNSPLIYEKCSFFANSEEQLKRTKEIIKLGNVLNVKGSQDRNKGKDKAGAVKYFDSIKVSEITPVQVSTQPEPTAAVADDDLPF